MKKITDHTKRFWKFLNNDSWLSLFVTLIIAFFVIKFILFPGLSLITGTGLPLVIVESCSMYHDESGLEKIFENEIYEDYDLGIEDTENWDFQNGLNKGDVIFVIGVRSVEVGDVIIFNGGQSNPIIHRAVDIGDGIYTTKGDHNPDIYNFDKNIPEEKLVGKALFKIPLIGWVKLIFFEGGRADNEKGLCR